MSIYWTSLHTEYWRYIAISQTPRLCIRNAICIYKSANEDCHISSEIKHWESNNLSEYLYVLVDSCMVCGLAGCIVN
jgi:hypothetical protein